jgi:hypothetical protein
MASLEANELPRKVEYASREPDVLSFDRKDPAE